MKACPDIDAMVTIADALHWDVDEGLRHLQTCADCRARVHVLAATHAALSEEEHVDDVTLAQITSALSSASRSEQSAERRTERRLSVVEAILAAVAAPVALVSGGASADSVPALAIAAMLAATLLAIGTRLRPRA